MQQVDISVAQTQITELLQSALQGEEIITTPKLSSIRGSEN
jgi:hypothetical protein